LRAIEVRKFSELYEEKVTSAAGYKYALVTDITSFFPTIYTHTIPWALHTKVVAKVHRKPTPRYYGNILDARSTGMQDGQTIGLPIGPDTSHIIAEIIGVAIDDQLKRQFGSIPQGFRYVDDFFLFFNTRHEAERALAAVTKAVASFELQLNPAKTRIIEVRELVEESWKYGLKKLTISPSRKQQRDDIHHSCEVLFALEKHYKDESLVKYGLKQLSSKIVKTSNWEVLEAYLLKCGFGFPNSIPVIVHIFATYHHHGYPLNMAAIRRFCSNLIQSAAAVDHHSEVAWLLWLCKELSIDLEPAAVQEVERMRSPVCSVILLDLHHAGVVTPPVNVASLASAASSDALLGSEWLLAYEAGRRLWLGNADTRFIDTDVFFGELLRAGVAFYVESNRIAPIFDFKSGVPGPDDFDFDSDEAVEDEFDFDDMDEEYFDKAPSDKEEPEEDELF
jgi:hypothetical protein